MANRQASGKILVTKICFSITAIREAGAGRQNISRLTQNVGHSPKFCPPKFLAIRYLKLGPAWSHWRRPQEPGVSFRVGRHSALGKSGPPTCGKELILHHSSKLGIVSARPQLNNASGPW